MKLNKKGFTLVELLVVIVILLAIMLVALPNINNTLEKRKEKDKTKTKELIESAALMYANDNDITTSTNIPLRTLVNDGYITKKEADICGIERSINCNMSSCTLNCD